MNLAEVKVLLQAIPLLQLGIDGQPLLHRVLNFDPANGVDSLHPVTDITEPLDAKSEPVVGDGVAVVLLVHSTAELLALGDGIVEGILLSDVYVDGQSQRQLAVNEPSQQTHHREPRSIR